MTVKTQFMEVPLTLPALRWRSLAFQALLIGTAVLLPTLAHLWDLPVLYLLPMHWPVLLAGLVYGWIGGGLVGALAPLTSFLLSGRPGPAFLPAMTVELAVYGLVAGLLREKARWNAWAALGGALIAGRIAYLGMTFLLGKAITPALLQGSLLPGVPAALVQLLILPWLAQQWVRAEHPRV